MDFKNILKNKTVKNAGWLISGRLANKLLAFIVGIITARYLGPNNFGLINYAAAYISFFASLCSLGISSVIIKDFVDNPEEEGKALGTALGLRAISSLLSALMIVGVVSIVDRDEPLTIAVAALSSIGLVFQIFDAFNQWFQAKLKSKYVAVATVIAYIAVSVYKIVLFALGKSVEWFALATSVDYIVIAVFLYIAYKKNNGPSLSFSLKKAKQLLSLSSSFIVSGLMVSIYASTDKLMLKQMLGEASVGHYGLAVSISTMWAFVLQAVIDSVYPSVIEAHSHDLEDFNRKNRRLYALVIYTALFISLIICIFARPIIGILYGEDYLPAVAPLRIIVWYTAFSYLGVARNAWVVCENKQRYLKYLYISAAVINVVLNIVLIPWIGTVGAALASLITQISTAVILPVIIPPLRPNAKLMLDALLLKDVFPK
ncbi:MAG: flippase [Oscillospiraceae bacterium]|nr:flippase [Oscillospiraceae bacterium]